MVERSYSGVKGVVEWVSTMNGALCSGGNIDIFRFRTLSVSDVTKEHGTDVQWFQGIIVIVLGFQVEVVNIPEKSPNLDQRTVGRKRTGSVTSRVNCMRNMGGAGSRRVRSI